MTSATPVDERSLATLSLFEGSDSFAHLWAELAAEFDFALERTADIRSWQCPGSGLRIVAAGGAEDQMLVELAGLAPEARGSFALVGADPSRRIAVAALRAGASDYFALPEDLGILRVWCEERRQAVRTESNRQEFVQREEAKYRFDGLIGTSEPLRRTLEVAARVIPHPSISVMILGETGTGKELLARAIHFNGPRRTAPFVDVNCAAIPEQLLESELFGHEKGSFTGATTAKPGLFEVAHGGTIFLDEIGHLPVALQGKLLRALDQRVIRRVGGTTAIRIDVRVIAATHVDLPDAVRRGEFREDLFHRLNVLPVQLPPLRVRGPDVLLLARHFLERFAASYELPVPAFTPAATRALADHPWSGNVRELRNVIERAVILCGGGAIDVGDLAFNIPMDPAPGTGTLPFPAPMHQIIRAAANEMVKHCGGNKSSAARRLDISRSRLLRLLDPTANESDSEAFE